MAFDKIESLFKYLEILKKKKKIWIPQVRIDSFSLVHIIHKTKVWTHL